MKERKIKALVQSIRTSVGGMHGSGLRRSLMAAGLSAVALASQAAETNAAAEAQEVAEDSGIARITVTARKASELVQDVPISISVIRAEQMVQENTNSIRDYFSKIPGLNLGRSGSGRVDISLRGVTTGDANPTMAVTIDDSPFGSSTASGGGTQQMPDIDPFDLQRIEVLRGPQGTLYGASNLGGLLKYVTVQPNTSKLGGRVQVDGSEVAHGGAGFGVRGAINIPVITDQLGLRLSVFDRQDPGWIDNHVTGASDYNKAKTKGGRAALLWTPLESLSVRASGLHQSSTGNGSSIEAVDAKLNPIYGEYVGAAMAGSGTYQRTIDFYDVAVNWDMGWATLNSTTSYGRLRYDAPQDISPTFGGLIETFLGGPYGALATAPTSLNKRSQELRLDSPENSGKLDWRVGLFYTSEDAGGGQKITVRNRTTGALVAGLPTLIDTVATNQFEEYAAFGVLTWHFTDQFDIQGGARYSHNSQEFRSKSTGLLAPSSDAAVDSSESKTTYLFTPRYKVSKELMVYGTVSTGYRPGGPNLARGANIPLAYGADTTKNLELGAKGQFFNNMLQVDAAVFKIDWTNIQLQLRDAATNFTYYSNAGGAKSEGVEVSAVLYPAAGWTVSGNAALTHAVLTSSAGANSNGKAGDRLPFVAPVTGALSVNRDYKLGNGWTAFGGVSGNYVGYRDMNIGSTPTAIRYRLPGYAMFGLTAGLRNKDWSVNAFVRNLGDKRGLLYTQDAGQLIPSKAYPIAQGALSTTTPRTVGISVARSF